MSPGSCTCVGLLTLLQKICRMEEQNIQITASSLPLAAKSDEMTSMTTTSQENQVGIVLARSPCGFAWKKTLQFQKLPTANNILNEFNGVAQHLQTLI